MCAVDCQMISRSVGFKEALLFRSAFGIIVKRAPFVNAFLPDFSHKHREFGHLQDVVGGALWRPQSVWIGGHFPRDPDLAALLFSPFYNGRETSGAGSERFSPERGYGRNIFTISAFWKKVFPYWAEILARLTVFLYNLYNFRLAVRRFRRESEAAAPLPYIKSK